ncbi:RNA-dependent DNA polymerase [Elizabethkingia anophelis]|uniref:reverse transcriptase domain-containing protein n=1 Tax=Elizabethkingia anophelis TaxID=1117645 RepID=UPI0004E2AD39|nr:reverse transcriptase domain-containing protein [Elizabethkingia anophelis]KFC34869.1 DNA polymerase [Elizabethkingia anophelis]MCL1689341.1 reverse transcriptase domain-containing protein [Elizabethkingia anophelis]MCT3786193.1 RNA-dependent DNA polymerase [Elizabethkingia anophelis]MDV3499855.1 RNA-dependent DNA polymerase [Elizabethkingia anophelis]MDV3574516.1 RNA-dependent DNA polymerase [Elizabethkingia anophelis]
MEKILIEDIIKISCQLKSRFEKYHNNLHLWYERNSRNYVDYDPKRVKYPDEWNINNKYNPYYVLKRKKQIAKSVSKNILAGKYMPQPPHVKEIPKPNGGTRSISIYQIQDSAVSYRIYKNLLIKNRHRFSSLTYAYRNDRNIHFAIQDIAHELSTVPRIFVAEFDFSDFFGSIDHEYLFKQLRTNGYLISEIEMKVINAFLKDRKVGIPLGTSISLFLANVVCWRLDRQLEDEGIRFARYADDTIIWSKDYTKISKAFDIIANFSKEAKININYKKSDGISLLKRDDMPSEFYTSKEYIEFLGYKISTEKVSIKNKSVEKIKNHIAYLLYKSLIHPLKQTDINRTNLPMSGRDKNFLTALMEVRRYLYGNLTEITLKKYMNGTYKVLSFKGIMSFYPLINDVNQLKDLDEWLISTIMNILRLRRKLLLNAFPNEFDFEQIPFTMSKNQLLDYCKNTVIRGKKGLLEIPSFLRIHNALKLGLINEGIVRVMNPHSGYYR